MAIDGRREGAIKTAAARTGCTAEEWKRRRATGERWCFRCRQWKRVDVFSVDNSRRGGRASSCKACASDASTASRYGMTLIGLIEFRAVRGGKCEICSTAETLYIDHDHSTDKPRGLLCPSCNTAIGLLREDPQLFAAALAYLERVNGRK